MIKIFAVVNGEIIEDLEESTTPTYTRIHYLLKELSSFEDLEVMAISYHLSSYQGLADIIYNNVKKTVAAMRSTLTLIISRPMVYFAYPHSMTTVQNRALYRICRILGLKIILDIHDTIEQAEAISNGVSALNRETERYCFRNATVISFSLNPAMWAQLTKMYQVPEEKKVVFVPNAFEESFMGEYQEAYKSVEGRFNICYIGGIGKNRGVDILISASSNLHSKYPYLKLNLFGEYSEGFSEETKEIIECSDFITRNLVKRKDLPGMLKDIDLFVMPYNPEIDYTNLCSPTKFFEYMATGRPVLSTKCKSVLDLAADGVIYADYNVNDFEEKIEKLIKNHELREKLSVEQASQRYHHTWKERATRIHDALMGL